VCKYNEFLNTKTFLLKKVSTFKSNEAQTVYFKVLRLQIYTFFLIEKIFIKPFMKKPETQFVSGSINININERAIRFAVIFGFC
jgi:hypothetical protein